MFTQLIQIICVVNNQIYSLSYLMIVIGICSSQHCKKNEVLFYGFFQQMWRIWSHLRKKSLMENDFFCAVSQSSLPHMKTDFFLFLKEKIKPSFIMVKQGIQ